MNFPYRGHLINLILAECDLAVFDLLTGCFGETPEEALKIKTDNMFKVYGRLVVAEAIHDLEKDMEWMRKSAASYAESQKYQRRAVAKRKIREDWARRRGVRS